MRDIALALIFGVSLLFALRHTWAGVLLWTWISVMSPHRLTYGFAYDAPWAYMAALVTLASIPFNRKQLHLPRDPALIALILFVIWICITTAFAYYPGSSWEMLNKVLKIQLMTLVAAAAIRERKHIEYFIWVNALSIGFYGLKGGLFTLRLGGGERVWGPSGSFIEGNNEVGLAIVAIIPLLNYLRLVSTRAWVRTALLATMLLSAVAALGTQSRGAFLAFAAMGVVMWTRSQRKVVSGLFITVVAALVVAFMPASWEARMQTIDNYQEDSSAMGRINAWWNAFHLANGRFFGGGFDIYRFDIFEKYAPNPIDVHAAHSIYFQVLGEHGYVGLLLFLAMGAYTIRSTIRIRREAKSRVQTLWLYHLAGMIQVSMAGFAVGGAFLSLAYFDLPYNIMVMVVAGTHWLREKRWQTEEHGAFGASVPIGKLPRSLQAKATPP